MQHTKKMILVEPELLDRLKSNNGHISENAASRLDSEMQSILNSNLNDREKWTLYSQTLQRYLHAMEEDRRPLKLSILTDTEDESSKLNKTEVPYKEEKYEESTSVSKSPPPGVDETPRNLNTFATQYTPSYMVKLIPKTYKRRGEALIDFIIRSKPKIWWKEGGEVVIDNEVISGSNIFDLISDTVRPLKRIKPLGWEKFASTLKHLNVPLTYVGNPSSLDYINQLSAHESSESNNREEFNASTPKSIKSKDISKKQLNWERWNPYKT